MIFLISFTGIVSFLCIFIQVSREKILPYKNIVFLSEKVILSSFNLLFANRPLLGH